MTEWQQAFDDAQRTRTANVVCMKWGALYGPEWVNKLYGMVNRNTTWNIRFVCLTDDPTGIRPEVECLPFPPLDIDPAAAKQSHGRDDPWWRKISLYSPNIHDLKGLTLYLDVDVLVVGNIDALFEYSGRFCMMPVWRAYRFDNKVGNSSVVRLFVGNEAHIVERFNSESLKHWVDTYSGDQTFVSDTAGDITFFPTEWCASFKDTLPRNGIVKFFSRPNFPKGARILVFSGLNTPPAAIKGEIDPTKSPNKRRQKTRFRRRFRPATWVKELWRE